MAEFKELSPNATISKKALNWLNNSFPTSKIYKEQKYIDFPKNETSNPLGGISFHSYHTNHSLLLVMSWLSKMGKFKKFSTRIMFKYISTFLITIGLSFSIQAAEVGVKWDKAPDKSTDLVALQNGAKIFINYCQNCHAAAYMRFNRLKDLGLTEQQIKDNLLFSTDKIGETMKISMKAQNAKDWYGVIPPDLTLIARSKSEAGKGSGADYLYTYLRTYYRDDTKTTGWNNLAYPNSAMPHVLWELQGERKPIFTEIDEKGKKELVLKNWEQVNSGKMTNLEYDKTIGDLVGYLQWMSEPVKNNRIQIGILVLFFLLFFISTAWKLNNSFWKNVK